MGYFFYFFSFFFLFSDLPEAPVSALFRSRHITTTHRHAPRTTHHAPHPPPRPYSHMGSSALRGTAMVGLLGVGVGVNCFGTYYILAQSGALPPSMMPSSSSADDGRGQKTTTTSEEGGGEKTIMVGGKRGGMASAGGCGAAVADQERTAMRADTTKRWWKVW